MPQEIDTAGAFATIPTKSGEWHRRVGISTTRDWSSVPWIALNNPEDVVIQDFFWASQGGLRMYARDADILVSWRQYERYNNNDDRHGNVRVIGNGGPAQMFGTGISQSRGQLYAYFISGRVVLERRWGPSPHSWHGTFEIFTQGNYHRGAISTYDGCTGIAFTSTASGVAYGNMTTKGWTP